MSVTDADQQRVTELLLRDIAATLGAGHAPAVHRYAEWERHVSQDQARGMPMVGPLRHSAS